MTSRMPLLWLVLLALLLCGCDSAEDLVNRRLPPVPSEQHHSAAIQAAGAAIARLPEANAGFNLRIEDIEASLNAKGFAERLGVGPLKLRGDRQLVLAEVAVARTFSGRDFPELDETTKKLIETLKPEIKGTISLGLGLTATEVSQDGRLTIGLRLLPLFRNMEVERVVLAGELDVDLLVTLVNRLADRISSDLSSTDIADVSFPAVPFKTADPSQSVAFRTADGAGEKVTLTARPVPPPVDVESIVWLVDGGDITFIAELALLGGSSAQSSAAPADYARLHAEFSRKLLQGLGVANPTGANWIAMSRPLVAGLINAAVGQSRLCVGAKALLAERDFSSRVEIPDMAAVGCAPKIDCTPRRDCTAADICEQSEDCRQARDCQVCALGACFNDPACERQKAAARYDCEVRKAGRKLECEQLGAPARIACETETAAQTASCEAQKSARRLACEAGKRDLEKLAQAGTAASLAGTAGGSADLSICIEEFTAAPSLDRLAATATVRGQGAVDLGLEFVPLGIGDYFTCTFPWSGTRRVQVVLPDQPTRLDAALTLETSGPKPSLRATIRTSAMAARMRPDLRELLLASYDMRGSCAPAGGMLDGMTLDVTTSVPAIGGDFRLPGEERTLVLTMEPMRLHVSGTDAVAGAVYAANEKALVLGGDRPAAPAD
ncbi:MAG: hypothetical protein AB7S92_24750 [Parvibaculaceae bacterium]